MREREKKRTEDQHKEDQKLEDGLQNRSNNQAGKEASRSQLEDFYPNLHEED